jgi:hypothetical protein
MVFRALGLHLMSVGSRESGPTVKEIRMAYTRVMDGRQNWLRTALAETSCPRTSHDPTKVLHALLARR